MIGKNNYARGINIKLQKSEGGELVGEEMSCLWL